MSEAVVRFTAQDAAVLASLREIADQMRQIGGAAVAAERGASSVSSAIGRIGSTAKSVLTGKIFETLYAALDDLENRTARSIEKLRDAGRVQMDLSGAESAAIRALGRADMTPAELSQRVADIGRETGADLEGLFGAARSALAKRGGMSASEALNQVAAAARLDPNLRGDQLAGIALGGMEFRGAFGGGAEQALGAMLAGQRATGAEDLGEFSRNVMPALIGLKNFGEDFKGAAALVGAIRQVSGDQSGTASGTAALQFAKQLRQATDAAGQQGKTLTERMEFLLSPQGEASRRGLLGGFDARAARGEMGDLTGGVKSIQAFRQLLTPDSEAVRVFRRLRGEVPSVADAEQELASTIAAQGQGELAGAGRFRALGRAAKARRNLGVIGDQGQAMEFLAELQKDIGGVGAQNGSLWMTGEQRFLGISAGRNAREQELLRFLMDPESTAPLERALNPLIGHGLFPDLPEPIAPGQAVQTVLERRLQRVRGQEDQLKPAELEQLATLKQIVEELRRQNNDGIRVTDSPAERARRNATPMEAAR